AEGRWTRLTVHLKARRLMRTPDRPDDIDGDTFVESARFRRSFGKDARITSARSTQPLAGVTTETDWSRGPHGVTERTRTETYARGDKTTRRLSVTYDKSGAQIRRVIHENGNEAPERLETWRRADDGRPLTHRVRVRN
ncbi:MAG: hypothetical protein ABEN55_10585, partial [Bradymonadaceae bacterium]